MAMAIDLHTKPLTAPLDPAALRLVDTDIHNDLPSLEELRPFLAKQWHPWLDSGGPAFGRALLRQHGLRADGRRRARGGWPLRPGDPDWTIQQLMTKYRIDIGVLTGSIIGL